MVKDQYELNSNQQSKWDEITKYFSNVHGFTDILKELKNRRVGFYHPLELSDGTKVTKNIMEEIIKKSLEDDEKEASLLCIKIIDSLKDDSKEFLHHE